MHCMERRGVGRKLLAHSLLLFPSLPPPLPFRCLPWSLFTEARGLFLLMVILTNACKHNCSSLYYPWSPGGGGGREGGTQQSFTWEGSAPGLAPYPCKPFQNVLLSYTFNRQIVPLSHTSFRPLHPFLTAANALSFNPFTPGTFMHDNPPNSLAVFGRK